MSLLNEHYHFNESTAYKSREEVGGTTMGYSAQKG